MAERWSEETETYFADAFRRTDTSYIARQPDGYHRSNARALLKFLADAGLLVEPGGETRVEWGCRHDDGGQVTQLAANEDYVAHHVKTLRLNGHRRASVMRRVVHTGPWQPTDTKEPSP